MKSGSVSRKPFEAFQARVTVVILFTFASFGLVDAAAPSGPKPAMGWNSLYVLGCKKAVREDHLRYAADQLVEKGLDKCGYNKLVVECGWEDYRNDDGTAVIKKKVFQNGLLPFSDYLKSKGISLGLSTWGGSQLCERKIKKKRSLGLTQQSLVRRDENDPQYWKTYISNLAQSGLTYLMHRPCDWAYPDKLQSPDKAKEINSRYLQMAQAINDTGAKIYYATGEWGVSPEAQSKYKVPNSIRISDDALGDWYSFTRIVNGLVPFADKACPGTHNDLGFLQVTAKHFGNVEKITQFIFWAAAKSPLIFSAHIEKLDQGLIDILKNPGALAVNQDDLGKSITFKRRYTDDKDIWSGPLSDGSTVAVIINWSPDIGPKQIDLEDLGFKSAHLYDLWQGTDLGKVEKNFTTTIGGHGSLFLKLNQTEPAVKRTFQRYPAENADLMGTARLRDVNSKVKAASLIKPNGDAGVRWKNISGGSKKSEGGVLVSIDYINAELSPGNVKGGTLNYKRAVIIVNDEKKVYVDFPISGQTWEDVYEGFLVLLPLAPCDSNTIRIEGVDSTWAPDIVCLGVEVRP